MISKRRQAGFLGLDAVMALIVLTILIGLATAWTTRMLDQQDYRIAADQQRTVAEALSKYLKDNYSTVLSSATANAPAQISVSMLRNTNYLPSGFSATNLFGQTITGLARRPNPNQLEAIVITTGGQAIPEIGIRTIAENLGGPGGFISSTAPNVIQGVRGGWQVTLSNYAISPGAGHTASALFLMDGELANDYLYRHAVPGRPELNTMSTEIRMGGNNISNVGDITTSNLTATNTIKTATADVTGETYTGGWFRTRGDTGWYSEKWGGGFYQSDAEFVRIYNDKGLATGGRISAGTIQTDGRASIGEYLDIGSVASEGAACPKIGLQSKNSLGAPLSCQCLTSSCQSGVWKGPSAGLETIQLSTTFYTQSVLTCPAGYKRLGCSHMSMDDKRADRYFGATYEGSDQCRFYNGQWPGVPAYGYMDCFKQ
ncbi:pilus assembly protein PilV [Pseudomonas sp. PA15(2017)]|uniref:shufflon system plasmid conjugative transfer pilus tip adhesin PilV n=1 Tax=Pseudomonas sp. PA15(2017) TaxID=1932111 RepID=UPI00096A0654|nr:shufflon system plasmid conjugative transfer pilus tip adhesin PilV [Pseudomonas sp. PA15(2017)]OLU25497.1 pilus assembly protein PilV [Pseudomonas sp. PA15(2017)]